MSRTRNGSDLINRSAKSGKVKDRKWVKLNNSVS
jgi:hypothetical protein